MDRRNIRIGDWICDPSNFNYEMEAGINEVQYAGIFAPIPMSAKFTTGFKPETINGKTVYYRGEDKNSVVLENEGEVWRLSILTETKRFDGKIRFVHELQHIMDDCQIYWKVRCDCGERA